jgi:hypothetical protein
MCLWPAQAVVGRGAAAARPPSARTGRRPPPACGRATRAARAPARAARSSHVNFISGTNGSGKSAVLQALQICLGATARETGRGRNLRELIRTGADAAVLQVSIWNTGEDAYQPHRLGRWVTVERRIVKSAADAGGVSSTWRVLHANGRRVEGATRKNLIEPLLDHLNIAADNPLCVMTQVGRRLGAARSFGGGSFGRGACRPCPFWRLAGMVGRSAGYARRRGGPCPHWSAGPQCAPLPWPAPRLRPTPTALPAAQKHPRSCLCRPPPRRTRRASSCAAPPSPSASCTACSWTPRSWASSRPSSARRRCGDGARGLVLGGGRAAAERGARSAGRDQAGPRR